MSDCRHCGKYIRLCKKQLKSSRKKYNSKPLGVVGTVRIVEMPVVESGCVVGPVGVPVAVAVGVDGGCVEGCIVVPTVIKMHNKYISFTYVSNICCATITILYFHDQQLCRVEYFCISICELVTM